METLAQRIAKMGGGRPTVTVSAIAAPAPVVAAIPAPVAVAAPVQAPAPINGNVPAPWAKVGCIPCGGLGFSTAGNPCPICDLNAKNAGKPKSFDYILTPMGDGNVYWQLKTNLAIEGISPMVRTGAVTSEARVQAPAPATVTVPVAPAVVATAPAVVAAPVAIAAPAPVAPVAAPVAPATPRAAKGKKGFTLCLNCVVSKGEKATTRLVDVFKGLQEEFAATAGHGYYEHDAFKRRDEFAKIAEAIAEKLGADFVTADVCNGTPDFKALVEAIRPYAAMEIVGTSI